MHLEEQDFLILKALQSNARLSLRDLANKVALSPPTISSRIKAMEKAQIIRGYNTLIEGSLFALNLEAYIEIKVRSEDEEAFINALKCYSNIIFVDKISGEYNFILKAAFKDMQELESFSHKLGQSYGSYRCNIVMKTSVAHRSPFKELQPKTSN